MALGAMDSHQFTTSGLCPVISPLGSLEPAGGGADIPLMFAAHTPESGHGITCSIWIEHR